ncbi:MAG: hypothetical protein M3297_12980 [Thermoproteota archaeon]|nr:hypothetical protein [Thermoproteota archaeon]
MSYRQYATHLMGFKRSPIPEYGIRFLIRLLNMGSVPKISSFFGLRGQSAISKDDQSTILKLQEMQFIEEIEGKFFSGSATYRLTERGIFYLLSEMEDYPPILLTKYPQSIVLQTLVYQFFETQTIKRCTASMYSEITKYLKQCCISTIARLDSFKSSPSENDSKELVKELESDLTWSVKVLALKLAMMYSEASILRSTEGMTKDNAKVALYELENDMKRILSKDNKFRKILDSAYGELSEAYQEIRKISNQM